MLRTARGLRFARDSPLERDGFEPSVPGRADGQTVMGGRTGISKTGADLLGNRRFESISLQRRVRCEPEAGLVRRGCDGSLPVVRTLPRGFAAAPASTHLPLLSGEITFKIGDEVTVGGPGSCAFLPRGVPHAWKNTGAETGRVLFLATPAGARSVFRRIVVAAGVDQRSRGE